MPTSESIVVEVLTMSKCSLVCNVLRIILEYLLLWPYKASCQLLEKVESLSPIKKKLIGAIANMIWWIIAIIITYLIQEALQTHDDGESQERVRRQTGDRSDVPISIFTKEKVLEILIAHARLELGQESGKDIHSVLQLHH